MKRPVGIAYVLLTIAGLYCQFQLPKGSTWYNAGVSQFPVDVFVSILVLFFFKKMEGWPHLRK